MKSGKPHAICRSSPTRSNTSVMKPRISLLAEHEREDRRTKNGDPAVGLTKHVDFEALAVGIDVAAPRPSRAKDGRPPYPTVLMVKIWCSSRSSRLPKVSPGSTKRTTSASSARHRAGMAMR